MNRLRSVLALAACAFVLTACPKSAPGPSLGGSDDEKMDTIAAQLEELRTRQTTECSETCSIKNKVCSLRDTACEIAGQHSDRNEYQKRCTVGQEDCAKFNEACSACRG